MLVDDARLVAGHRLAGRAVTDIAGTVRQERVEHLGRAEAVEHVDACDLAPALADMRGQGLAGGDAEPQAVGARALADVLVREQRGVERRHAVENGRPVHAHDLEHAFGRRPVRPQHGGGADREREGQGVAEPVGKEQLGGGMHDVVLGDAENALAEQLRGRHQVGMDVLDALGVAGRARGVEPERDLVRHRVGGEGRRVRFGDEVLEGVRAGELSCRPQGSEPASAAASPAPAGSRRRAPHRRPAPARGSRPGCRRIAAASDRC